MKKLDGLLNEKGSDKKAMETFEKLLNDRNSEIAAEEKRQTDNKLKSIDGTVTGVFYVCAAVAGVIGVLETIKAVFQWFGYLFVNGMHYLGNSPTASIAEIARHKYLGMGFSVFDFHGLPAALASPLFLAIAGACAIVGSSDIVGFLARIGIFRRK